MEKNTKWAIILCTAVLIAWFFMLPKQQPNQSKQKAVQQQTNIASNSTEQKNSESKKTFVSLTKTEDLDFSINTNVAKISFTNKGGDIIGFELLNHQDKERPIENTEDEKKFYGVEMVNNDSASKTNKAFSISLDNNSYIEDNFSVNCSKLFFDMIENNEELKNKFPANLSDDGTIWVEFTQNFIKDDKNSSLTKKYTFDVDDYMFKLEVNIDDELLKGYTLKSASQIGPKFNIKDRYDYRRVIYYNEEDKDEDEIFSEKEIKFIDDDWNYVGIAGKYFQMVFYPETKNTKNVSYGLLKSNDDETKVSNEIYLHSSSNNDVYYIYVGPRTENELSKYNKKADNSWGLSGVRLDYSMPSSGFLSWLQMLLKWIMEFFYFIIPNWGVSIILLTLLLKVALFPLTKKSLMGNQKMQKIQPRLQEIKEKYKNNPQKMQAETAKLYKETGYNPISGCLPLILQFLVLWSMYQLFYNYFEFRGASFIPGWIDDLSRGDEVVVFEGSYPVIGNTLRILPIIYLVSQLLYGKITQNGGTATGSGMNMKIMMYGMPIMFFLLFYSAPAGLLLYWTVSNVFQLFQQIFINKMMKKSNVEQNNKNFKIAKK